MPPATPRTPLTLWGRHDRTRWSGGPSESPKRCSAGRWTRGWPKRAQSTEPIPGRPGRLARGPMAQPSCAWLERRRESSGGRRGREGGDAMRRGLIGGGEREVPKGDDREASTGDVVRHAGGRGLSPPPGPSRRAVQPTPRGAAGGSLEGLGLVAPRRVDSRPPSAADGVGVAAAGARETRRSALVRFVRLVVPPHARRPRVPEVVARASSFRPRDGVGHVVGRNSGAASRGTSLLALVV